ncbi:MAG TPA: DinB family protein [Thermoanaerobaculia bacterium]|nr:DinB family protein [Thermoanaerobaculia bacterium]
MSAKEAFLKTYDNEHATTMRVLRAYPADQLDLKPHPRSNSARDIAWIFVLERGLGTKVWNDEIVKGGVSGKPPKPPDDWNELLNQLESAHQEFRNLIASATEEQLRENVHFFVAPKTMGEISRMDWLWFLLHDQIHHRGQFSVYLRMAGGKVPSIYGPTADEPWI